MTTGTLLASLTAGALVLYVEGATLFTLWNLFPVLLAAGAVWRTWERRGATKSRGPSPIVAVFGLGTLAVVGTMHVAWLVDWHGFSTGSSTAGLVFVFGPFYALFGGGLAAAAAYVILAGITRLSENRA
jgi:hypothetical protein